MFVFRLHRNKTYISAIYYVFHRLYAKILKKKNLVTAILVQHMYIILCIILLRVKKYARIAVAVLKVGKCRL